MPNKTVVQIAAHLNNLFQAEFSDKTKGRFVLTHASLRMLSGRARLEGGLIKKIAECLVRDYGLVLIQTTELFGIEKEAAISQWREVPKSVLARETRRKASGTIPPLRTILNPAAVWPFPVDVRP